MIKHTLTAAALVAVMAAPATAQQLPAAKPGNISENSVPADGAAGHGGFVQAQHSTDWRGSKLVGATVYGPDNASIGDISDILIDNSGQVRAVVIGVGGFLGVGAKDVAVAFDALNIRRKADSSTVDKVTVNYSKDELKGAPAFAYYEPNPTQTTGSDANRMNDPSQK
jgi:hypothetical protein